MELEISSLIGNIVITNTSGDISIQNLDPTKKISLFNGPLPSTKLSQINIESDFIQLKNINPTGEIEIVNQTGKIEIKTLLTGDINITTEATGDIKIKATTGKINIEALNGIDIKAGIDPTQKNLLGEDTVDKLKEIIDVITDYMSDIISGDFATGVLIGGFGPGISVISKSIAAKTKLITKKTELNQLLSKKVTIN